MKVVLRSSQLSYELLEKIAVQVREGKTEGTSSNLSVLNRKEKSA